jgi:hypothetical protein
MDAVLRSYFYIRRNRRNILPAYAWMVAMRLQRVK